MVNLGGYSASANNVSSTVSPSGGTGATFNIVVGFAVSSISVTHSGNEYGSASISFTSSTGSGAVASPVLGTDDNAGEIVGANIINGGSGYETPPTITISPGGSGAEIDAILGDIGSFNEGKIIGYTVTNGGTNYGNPSVLVSSKGHSATAICHLAPESQTSNWGKANVDTNGNPRTFQSLNNIHDGSYSKYFFYGTDGDLPDSSTYILGWEHFKHAQENSTSLFFTGPAGGVGTSKVLIQYIIDNIMGVRKDCVLFISPDLPLVLNQNQLSASKAIRNFVVNGINRPTSYAVCDSGWKLQYDIYNDKYRWIPLNADIAGLCAQTETNFESWYSPAGLNRGQIKNIVSLAFNPNQQSRDLLYQANINPVVSIAGQGTYLYGDKTLLTKNSAFSYINVRRLFITLEKSIAKSSKYQLFEFNDNFTRSTFVGMVEPYLNMVKARRGIYDFQIVCDETNNTPEVIDNAQFVASIFIKPSRSINYIILNFVAVRTGVAFSEVLGAV